MKKQMEGFTLLELLVVVIIIGILATMALPQFGKAIDRAREAEADNVVSAILNAQMAYYQENNTFTNDKTKLLVTVPPMKDWDDPVITHPTGAATDVKASLAGGKHGHSTSHRVEGTLKDTGEKTVTVTRP